MNMLRSCILVIFVSLTFAANAETLALANARYADLLAAHVRDGKVDYRALKQNRARLDEALRLYAEVSEREFAGWTVPERLAYLINLYNLTVLRIVVDDYPISSIRKAGGWFSGDPFDWKSVTLFGHRISLNILLRNYIRRDYAEPGVHLALCQGARASPPLRAEPYSGDRLYEQFADQARVFLSRAPYNRIDTQRRRMHLSPVFKWYASDFARQAGGVEGYVRMIVPGEWGVRDVSGRFSISYTEFDWRLNDSSAVRALAVHRGERPVHPEPEQFARAGAVRRGMSNFTTARDFTRWASCLPTEMRAIRTFATRFPPQHRRSTS